MTRVCVCVCVCKPVHFSENKERDMKHQALKKTRLKRYFLTFIKNKILTFSPLEN